MYDQHSERKQVSVSEARVTILTWAIGLLCTGFFVVTGGAIPWAMRVQSDVSAMSTKLDALSTKTTPPAWFKDQVDRNTQDIKEIQKDVHKLGTTN